MNSISNLMNEFKINDCDVDKEMFYKKFFFITFAFSI